LLKEPKKITSPKIVKDGEEVDSYNAENEILGDKLLLDNEKKYF